MASLDVFNGDADGICALQQLRLSKPIPDALLVTGVKRDIALLERIKANAIDQITVLDISLDKNRKALLTLLKAGARISYFDHHYAGDVPSHRNLEAHINTQPDTCTSLIVNHYLKNQHWLWAATGAFGDNFDQSALALIHTHNSALSQKDISLVRNLGTFINYNAYGETTSDLHIPPATLFRALHPYINPIEFALSNDIYELLKNGYTEDMHKASSLQPEFVTEGHALYLLPAESWARRVSGVFGNQLAQTNPCRAHALLTRKSNNSGYLVSIRAPLSTKEGADTLCRQFETGGGRKAAAGINILPDADLDSFIAAFKASFP